MPKLSALRSFACRTVLATGSAVMCLSTLGAQTPTQEPAQAPARVPAPSGGHWSLYGDWLQANETTVKRQATPSISAALQWQSSWFVTEWGYLRAVREFSTVQGGFGSVGLAVHLGPVMLTGTIAGLVGQALASADTTGYRYSVGGATGYQSRYSFSSGPAYGGGAQLALTVPLFSALNLRASGGQWVFTGDPIKNDTQRLVAGAGLAIRFGGAQTRTTAGGN